MKDIKFQEWANSGTSWTRHEEFDKYGYLIIQNLWDAKDLFRPVPEERGIKRYWGTGQNQFTFDPAPEQVGGSIETYGHPQYRVIHSQIRLFLESVIGRKLYNTYYYDRFYFAGQKLSCHVDRDACEISVSVNISTNIDQCWPIWIKTPDTYDDKLEIIRQGDSSSICLSPGDGVMYKGCERPHWRDPLPSRHVGNCYAECPDNTYYHQVFFHYVLADGCRCHCANDMST